jgi:hypothetical protein
LIDVVTYVLIAPAYRDDARPQQFDTHAIAALSWPMAALTRMQGLRFGAEEPLARLTDFRLQMLKLLLPQQAVDGKHIRLCIRCICEELATPRVAAVNGNELLVSVEAVRSFADWRVRTRPGTQRRRRILRRICMLLTMPQRGADSSTFPDATNKAFCSTIPKVHFPDLKSATTLLRSAPIDSRMASFSRTAGANLENRGCGVQDDIRVRQSFLGESPWQEALPEIQYVDRWTLKKV